ncbi:MAG: thioredoxin fold domain-containing protein [Deltaproteobacteria bacterium]|nr:thioredoxin fold domain-containing protein [Deltaproteobacteria bacterium]
MCNSTIKNRRACLRLHSFWASVCAVLMLSAGIAQASQALTVGVKYPGLELGILSSAQLAPLNDKTLLIGDGLEITQAELMKSVNSQEPELRSQLEKNLLYILEQEASRRILVKEAEKSGISSSGRDERQVIRELIERKASDVSVPEEDLEAFYKANREMLGGAAFEQVKDGIRQYLIEDKRQQVVTSYISELTGSVRLRINESWVEEQSRLALDNPVDKARNSKKPTMVEFGAAGCVPCDMMQPILDNVRKNYTDKLNVVFVHVGEEQVLAARYGIRSIPVQVFFDGTGKEVFRHVGFFPEADVTEQLAQMGVKMGVKK